MRIHHQLSRYILVGLVTNGVMYLAYLGLTELGVPYLISMTVVYFLSLVGSFLVNRKWTFTGGATTSVQSTGIRYLVCYGLAYLANLGLLRFFVEQFHLPHQWVQALLILTIAMALFLAQRYWVFAERLALKTIVHTGEKH